MVVQRRTKFKTTRRMSTFGSTIVKRREIKEPLVSFWIRKLKARMQERKNKES